MAIAPPVTQSKTVLQTRASWSARDDRAAPAVWLGILWVGMIAGFGLDIPRYLAENPPAPRIVHLHAAVFTTWMLLLTAQVLLVLRDRIAWHRSLGWFAAGWACLMAIVGPWAVMDSQAVNLHNPQMSDPPFLSINIIDLAGFLLLLAWGIALRKDVAAHRRMMILATISLADPGFSRFSGYYLPNEPKAMLLGFLWIFYGNFLLIALMTAWDWYKGRLMRSFVLGAEGLLSAEFASTALYYWPPWKAATTHWIEAWARLHI
jgi:hypothetical protein